MLPLRRELSGDPTFAEHLADTRDALLDALDHQDVAFSRLTAALDIPHDPGRTQLCQALFDFDEHAEPYESVFAEELTKRGDFAVVTAIQGRERSEGGEGHVEGAILRFRF